MTAPGFNTNQTKQLSEMFSHVVDSLSKVVESTKQEIKKEIENESALVRTELKTEIKRLDEKLDNFIAITPTKYQVDRNTRN